MHFGKHETFHIRDGWLFKGLNKVKEEKTIFLDESAPEKLGLGKNMVRSLRFWMQAFGLTREHQTNRGRVQELTPFGELVLQFDPYQELDGTLWLLHHQLVCSDEQATTWYWFFNHYAPVEFTREDFIERLQIWITANLPEKNISKGTLENDFACLIHTYLPSQRDKNPEDLSDSPLSSLGLLSFTDDHDLDQQRIRRFHFHTGTNIPPLIFLYVLLSRQQEEHSGANQISLNTVLRDAKNVGRTFNIGLVTLEEILARIEDEYPDLQVRLTRTGGLDQLTLPNVSAENVLRKFYEKQLVTEEVRPAWSRPIN